MARRSSKNRNDAQVEQESDEHFAYIAGYTEGGVPYGVTWEEAEDSKVRAGNRIDKAPPAQKRPASLKELVQEMQIICDGMTPYYRRSTGKFIHVSDEHIELEDEEDLGDRPEWEREAISEAADILHGDGDDYVPLPSQHDIHEYSMMESFAHSITDPKVATDLFRALSGRGAFRRFKDVLQMHSIGQEWYKFKNDAYRELALEWCDENGIAWVE